MTPGALVLALRRRLEGGLRASWYREIVCPSILRAEPVHGTNDLSVCEVHVLTSAADWLNACWAIRSFYSVSGRSYALCIHDDGTLPERARLAIGRQFPEARLIGREQADAEIAPRLRAYPNCAALRAANPLSLKVFDMMHYGAAPRWTLLDSDVLFFSRPHELLRRIEDPRYVRNCANEDIASSYTAREEDVRERLGFELVPRFNSGLCVFQPASLRLDWLEEFLGLPDILSHPWRIEQTLFALSSSRFGADLLPGEYSVRLDRQIEGLPCRHYVGAIRKYFFKDGIATLTRRGMLNRSGGAASSHKIAEAVGRP